MVSLKTTGGENNATVISAALFIVQLHWLTSNYACTVAFAELNQVARGLTQPEGLPRGRGRVACSYLLRPAF
jgi:hypothetical protein